MKNQPFILFLFGASSTGKTSVAQTMISILPAPSTLSIGIDDVFRSLQYPINTKNYHETPRSNDGFSFSREKDREGNSIVHLHTGPVGRILINSMYEHVENLVRKGFNIIIDEVMASEESFEYGLNLLKNYPIYISCITTPLNIREAREKERKNRFIGHTRSQERSAYTYKGYHMIEEEIADIVIDSSQSNQLDIAIKISSYIADYEPRGSKILRSIKSKQ